MKRGSDLLGVIAVGFFLALINGVYAADSFAGVPPFPEGCYAGPNSGIFGECSSEGLLLSVQGGLGDCIYYNNPLVYGDLGWPWPYRYARATGDFSSFIKADYYINYGRHYSLDGPVDENGVQMCKLSDYFAAVTKNYLGQVIEGMTLTGESIQCKYKELHPEIKYAEKGWSIFTNYYQDQQASVGGVSMEDCNAGKYYFSRNIFDDLLMKPGAPADSIARGISLYYLNSPLASAGILPFVAEGAGDLYFPATWQNSLESKYCGGPATYGYCANNPEWECGEYCANSNCNYGPTRIWPCYTLSDRVVNTNQVSSRPAGCWADKVTWNEVYFEGIEVTYNMPHFKINDNPEWLAELGKLAGIFANVKYSVMGDKINVKVKCTAILPSGCVADLSNREIKITASYLDGAGGQQQIGEPAIYSIADFSIADFNSIGDKYYKEMERDFVLPSEQLSNENDKVGCEMTIKADDTHDFVEYGDAAVSPNIVEFFVERNPSSIGEIKFEKDTFKMNDGEGLYLRSVDKLGCKVTRFDTFNYYSSFSSMNVYAADDSGNNDFIFQIYPFPSGTGPGFGTIPGSLEYRKLFDDNQMNMILENEVFKGTRKLICEFNSYLYDGVFRSENTKILMNKKDESRYQDGQIFIISDKNPEAILESVSASIWPMTNWDDWADTSLGKRYYPTHIYHVEGNFEYPDESSGVIWVRPEEIETDSLARFADDYLASVILPIKSSPSDTSAADVLVNVNVPGLPPVEHDWWKDAWLAYDYVVVTDRIINYESYKKAMVSAVFASLINAPLFFADSNNIAEWQNELKNRLVAIVGDLSCGSCLTQIKNDNFLLGYDPVENRIYFDSNYEAGHDSTIGLDDLQNLVESVQREILFRESNPNPPYIPLVFANLHDIEQDYCDSLNIGENSFSQIYCRYSLVAPYLVASLDAKLRFVESSPASSALAIREAANKYENDMNADVPDFAVWQSDEEAIANLVDISLSIAFNDVRPQINSEINSILDAGDMFEVAFLFSGPQGIPYLSGQYGTDNIDLGVLTEENLDNLYIDLINPAEPDVVDGDPDFVDGVQRPPALTVSEASLYVMRGVANKECMCSANGPTCLT